jgi:hypothetical protein
MFRICAGWEKGERPDRFHSERVVLAMMMGAGTVVAERLLRVRSCWHVVSCAWGSSGIVRSGQSFGLLSWSVI